jgi:nicotinamidase-related amidase
MPGLTMNSFRLGDLTHRTMHVCVDMQRMFAPGSSWGSPWTEQILPAVAEIAGRFPERTVFTRFIPPCKPDDMPGMWQRYYCRWRDMTRECLEPTMLELLPPLQRLVPPASVVDKATYSAFSAPLLPRWLCEREADGIIVTGAETDVCILATILGAVELGYRVVIVTDAICSSSDGGHDALIDLYHKRFSEQIETADTKAILTAWPCH